MMTLEPPNHEKWQPKILTINRSRIASWFVESIVNVYGYNNCELMNKFYNRLMQIDSFILDELSPTREKVWLCPSQKNGTINVIFNLKNIFFLPNSPCNLVNLTLFNNNRIFYNDENKILYNLRTKEVLT